MANKAENKRLVPKTGVKTNTSPAKTKTSDRRAKKKLSATLMCFVKTENELSKIQWDSIPLIVQKWLTVCFAKEKGCIKTPEEGSDTKTISSEVQANVWKEKKVYVRSSPCDLNFPEEVRKVLKDVDQWSFDIFALSKASGMKSLKYMMCELFSKYNLLDQFKIPVATLVSFAETLEVGYNKHKNAYHNSIHAADVIQTVHSLIIHTGMMHWFTDLEILALIFSASIHDYEHTGTTNTFHIQTRSEAAILYNDMSVLENHHISAAYKLMQNKGLNILANLTEVQWRELRNLVIKLVLATDILKHFQNMSSTRQILHSLQQKERPDKTQVMCMMLHTADISHPAKPWELAYKWAEGIMDEFFKQGDREAELGMPISTFCDRKTTNIAETQLVFIDIFIQPSFFLLLEVIDKIVVFLKNKASRSGSSSRESGQNTSKKKKGQDKPLGKSPIEKTGTNTEKHIVIIFDVPLFKANLLKEIETNRIKWKEALRKEIPGIESDKARDQVSKGKGEEGKTQKASQEKRHSAGLKRHCVGTECPITSKRHVSDKGAFSPLDVNFVVYNADSSELLQPQDSCTMDVTESYEEFVDSEISRKKAAAKSVAANIKEMRNKIPKSKPLRPDESDDIIIEEIIPDDSQDELTSKESTGQDDAQQSPNAEDKCATTNQSDMDIFSLWDEEIKSQKVEQQKKQQEFQDGKSPDATLQMQGKQNKDSQRRKGTPAVFVLQVISVDGPSVQGGTGAGPNQDPRQQEINKTADQESVKTPPEDTHQENETPPCGAAAVSISSLDCEIFKIPL